MTRTTGYSRVMLQWLTRELHQLNRLKLCDAFATLADGGSVSLSLFTYKNNINVSADLSDANA